MVASLLAACGGDGGDDGSTPAATAEGVYGGMLVGSDAGRDFEALVLDNGDFWAIYGDQTASEFLVTGFVQGHGTSNNGNFTASDTKDFGFAPALAATTAATYNAEAKTITGRLSYSGQTVEFSGGPIAGSQYVYDKAAALSEISGSWSVIDTQVGDPVALTIASNGSFTGTSAAGCRMSGSISAHPSGKNVFNVSLSFGPAPCILANQGATGIALTYPLQSGKRQLIVAGFDATRTNGTAIFGVR